SAAAARATAVSLRVVLFLGRRMAGRQRSRADRRSVSLQRRGVRGLPGQRLGAQHQDDEPPDDQEERSEEEEDAEREAAGHASGGGGRGAAHGALGEDRKSVV